MNNINIMLQLYLHKIMQMHELCPSQNVCHIVNIE